MSSPPSLPDHVLIRILALVSSRSALHASPLGFALVCRRWAALRSRAAHLLVRENAHIPGAVLAQELREYAGPTRLELLPASVLGLRDLWEGLGDHSRPGPALVGVILREPSACCHVEYPNRGGTSTPPHWAWGSEADPPGSRAPWRKGEVPIHSFHHCLRWEGCSVPPPPKQQRKEQTKEQTKFLGLSLGASPWAPLLGRPRRGPRSSQAPKEGASPRPLEVCPKNGPECAWFAFTGAFLPSHPELRTLRLQDQEHGSCKTKTYKFKELLPCSTKCNPWGITRDPPSELHGAPPIPDDSALLRNLAGLSRLRSLRLETVNPAWPPAWPSALPRLRSLHVKDDGSSLHVPAAVGALVGLTELRLELRGLRDAPPSELGALSSLRKLTLDNWGLYGLPHIPATVSGLQCLTHVSLKFHRMAAPDAADALWTVTSLRSVSFTAGFAEFPQGVTRLTQLQELMAEWNGECPDGLPLRFPEALGGSLRSLTLRSQCLNLPRGFGSLMTALRDLSIFGGSFVKMNSPPNPRLGCDFSCLTGLQTLTLQRLSSAAPPLGSVGPGSEVDSNPRGVFWLGALQAGFGGLPSLKKLVLRDLKGLQEVPAEISHLCALRELVLDNSPHVLRLSEGFGRLPLLAKLRLAELEAFSELSPDFVLLPSLTELVLEKLPCLGRLPDGFGQLESLKKLVIADLRCFCGLSADFGRLPRLHELVLEDLPTFSRLPREFGDLASLARLRLNKLPILEIPRDLGQLAGLRELEIRRCGNVTSLPEDLNNLSSLARLVLKCVGVKREDIPSDLISGVCTVDVDSPFHWTRGR